ncbi:hypothetical protein [Mycolicibacterium stellerae]|uniref:hypothetical protein n=1 Tax=Mycolicibacterium stellerae TaxID=2358193 RepID=UPI000F0BD3D1|nr:hypothetical protein [Mycolicibacterium stellerae]
MTTDRDDERVELNLDEAERELMVLVLNEYAGSAQMAVELLPPLIGKSSYDEWGDYVFPLMESIDASEPLTNLDWACALLLTEFGFGSDMVANARRFGPARDEYWVLVLRSLQSKLSNHSPERLLKDNATFPPQGSARNDLVPDVPNDVEDIELDDDERRLVSVTLGAYDKSPTRGFELLAPVTGQATFEEWAAYVADLHQAVDEKEPMRELEWTRALFLTEIGFTSTLLGFGNQFRGSDKHGITVLRSLQVTINRDQRHQLFRDNATYPWIRRPQR